ncbi:MAG TPA: DUF397 domain-containing protein [Streptosporangiaceae bacterium]|nr:DUF397 domain-containing protein [Streptosporangiaceae bacterium]
MSKKPTVEDLGIEVDAQQWRRSGEQAGSIEVAFVPAARVPAGVVAAGSRGEASAPGDTAWVLMRVAGDPENRVLVYDRNEWECFLDGVRNGEFDDTAAP